MQTESTPAMQPGQPPQGAGPGTGQPGGQPPFGSSPATGPTQNRGFEAAAVKSLGVALDGLTMVLQAFGANTEPGRDILETLKKLGKYVPPGAVSPADKMAVYQKLMMDTQKGAQQMSQMKQAAAQGGGAAPQQQPPPAGGGGAPMAHAA